MKKIGENMHKVEERRWTNPSDRSTIEKRIF